MFFGSLGQTMAGIGMFLVQMVKDKASQCFSDTFGQEQRMSMFFRAGMVKNGERSKVLLWLGQKW